MPRVALWFFAVAPIYVLVGMGFGIFMGATENFTLAPAHAHLNLIGWVTMALYGTFYALAREASQKLAWATFWLNNAAAYQALGTPDQWRPDTTGRSVPNAPPRDPGGTARGHQRWRFHGHGPAVYPPIYQ